MHEKLYHRNEPFEIELSRTLKWRYLVNDEDQVYNFYENFEYMIQVGCLNWFKKKRLKKLPFITL